MFQNLAPPSTAPAFQDDQMMDHQGESLESKHYHIHYFIDS